MPTQPTLNGDNARRMAAALSHESKAVQEVLFQILEQTFSEKRNWEQVLKLVVPALKDNTVIMEIANALKHGNVLEAMDIAEAVYRRIETLK